jgi:hypothetical protein
VPATPLPPIPRPGQTARRRPPACFVPLAALLGVIAVAGCSPDQTSRKLLLAPHEGTFAINGQVRLTGVLADESGGLLGNQVVDQANDVKVHVEGPAGYQDSVLTRNGAFTFSVDTPGFYRVKCCVVSADTAGHIDVVVTGNDTTQTGILTLGSPTGIIKTYPNPFIGGASHGVGVEANISTLQNIEVFCTTLYGYRVWHYSEYIPANTDTTNHSFYLHIHWIGVDDANQPVPDGLYWAVLHANGVYSYSLVSKEPVTGAVTATAATAGTRSPAATTEARRLRHAR